MPGRYTVTVAPAAERQLKALGNPLQTRIVTALLALETDPHPPGSVKLQGADDFFRLRVGDYRVVYQIRDKDLIVLVVKVGHRKDIYRRLPR